MLSDALLVVLMGALNSKRQSWHSRVVNPVGNALRNFADSYGLDVIGPTEPTHYSHTNLGDVLAIAVLKDIGVDYEIETINKLSSKSGAFDQWSSDIPNTKKQESAPSGPHTSNI